MDVVHGLPTLSAGAHDADAGEACVMEYVSVLAGEPWSDRPECTHPVLAHEARTTNDLLSDADRSRFAPLVGRLFGTHDNSPEVTARLRLRQAQQVLRLIDPAVHAEAAPHIARAESLLAQPAVVDETLEVEQAWSVARTLPARTGDLDPRHEEHHLAASRIMAFALSPDLTAAEAWSLTALVAAHRIAAGECRADCGNERARARRAVRDLGELLDVYDDVTGRVATPLEPHQAEPLADRL